MSWVLWLWLAAASDAGHAVDAGTPHADAKVIEALDLLEVLDTVEDLELLEAVR